MLRSMTGYGRGEMELDGLTITVELRAVNNRYLDCNVKMPRSFLFAEEALKERLKSQVSRGKVDIFVNTTATGGDDQIVTVNEALARSYLEALGKIDAMAEGLKPYGAADVARFADVLTVEKKEEDQDKRKVQLLDTLDLAIADFNAMRQREGQKLKEDVLAKAQRIEEMVGEVEKRSPETVAAYRQRLEEKMRETLENTQLDESRIVTEAAIFADKVAVDEETVRLRSHLSQLRQLLESEEPVGRKLDFLIQEFNRETNTIGSKCTDLNVTRIVVDMKAEIEKIREQVQNLE